MATQSNNSLRIKHTITGAVIIGITTIAFYSSTNQASSQSPIKQPLVEASLFVANQPKIQIAILLDTSSSMDGLIDQARNQIWQAVNEFSRAKRNGIKPTLEVAVYEYGNDRLKKKSGYTRKVLPLTNDLDKVSEALFSLTTNGGSEFCGMVIDTASKELNWSQSENDIKAIFIAGNEAFSQGPMHFRHAINNARSKGITVNTIHAGSYKDGAQTGWKEGAILAGGNYMNIDHNHKITHIVTPHDKRISELNVKLNQTYIPYGKQGQSGRQRQMAQDEQTNNISSGLLSERVKSKTSSVYNNENWDLVDALEKEKVELDEIQENDLPAAMKPMSKPKRKAYIKQQSEQRNKIKREIVDLSNKRDAFISEQKLLSPHKNVKTLDKALIGAIHKQGIKKSYEFK